MSFMGWVNYAAQLASLVFVIGGLVGLLITPVWGFCGKALVVASYVMGIDMWLLCAATVGRLWGTWAVLVGILLAGIGIAPMAVVALLFHKQWSDTGWLFTGLLMVFLCRVSGYGLLKRA